MFDFNIRKPNILPSLDLLYICKLLGRNNLAFSETIAPMNRFDISRSHVLRGNAYQGTIIPDHEPAREYRTNWLPECK